MTPPVFAFDVESVGLHGEAFAVAGGVYYPDGRADGEFVYAVSRETARGADEDRAWIAEHVPVLKCTHDNARAMRDAFWTRWLLAVERSAAMVAFCSWPVEAGFLSTCVADAPASRATQGPYPLHEVASLLLARGVDPLGEVARLPAELPAHNPLADARLAARLWFQYLAV